MLHKSANVDSIVRALHRLSAGESLLPPGEVVELLRLALRQRQRDQEARSRLDLLTRRELEVLTALCRPALRQDAFVAPASAREIAEELVVTEAAVKQHLLRLYQKFRIPEGTNRRAKLANEVIAAGVVRPLPDTPAAPSVPAQPLPANNGHGHAIAGADARR